MAHYHGHPSHEPTETGTSIGIVLGIILAVALVAIVLWAALRPFEVVPETGAPSAPSAPAPTIAVPTPAEAPSVKPTVAPELPGGGNPTTPNGGEAGD